MPDVSFPDLCGRAAGDGRRLERFAVPPLRLILVGVEPVSFFWHRRTFRQPYWRLYITDRDGVALLHRGRRLAYRPDRITVIPGWTEFTFLAHREVGHAFIHFELPTLPSAVVAELLARPSWLDAPDLLARFRTLARRLAGDAADHGVLALEAHAIAEAAVAQLLAALPGPARARCLAAGGGRLAPALALVAEHLDRPLAVADLARALGVGEAACARRFRRELGCSPAQWIIERRVALAADLLLTSDLAIDAIAARCGFPNRHYFTRVFARRLGHPPARFRAAYAQGG